ncbi:MAG: 4Fe-4S binding protein [Thermodesulfobacteriota bacterium]
MDDLYMKLARHLAGLVMGYPFSEALLDLLREMFTPLEAEAALAIPNDLAPLETADFETIAARSDLARDVLAGALEASAGKASIFSGPTRAGRPGYALLQVGYGQPQTHFWHGRQDERARKMAKLVLKYFTVPVTGQVYGSAPTKSFKYSPSGLVVDVPLQGVMPQEQIGPILQAAEKIALAHCPCRVSAKVLGRTDCPHSLEVCFKYDEMAEFLLDRGLARPVSKDEAYSVLAACEKEGLVHMVDNALGKVKHTCNCCGHYCWNVGIIRRRKIPRDQLMAVYFLRETVEEECIGCGSCAEVCPVGAVAMVEDRAVVDLAWCIGCGVCAVRCPAGAISIVRRGPGQAPGDFHQLFVRIKEERSRT